MGEKKNNVEVCEAVRTSVLPNENYLMFNDR